MSAAHFIS